MELIIPEDLKRKNKQICAVATYKVGLKQIGSDTYQHYQTWQIDNTYSQRISTPDFAVLWNGDAADSLLDGTLELLRELKEKERYEKWWQKR